MEVFGIFENVILKMLLLIHKTQIKIEVVNLLKAAIFKSVVIT